MRICLIIQYTFVKECGTFTHINALIILHIIKISLFF